MVDQIILVVVIMVFAMMAELIVYATRYRKVPPSRAMVVFGRKMQPGMKIGYMVISGGGKFILPIIESTDYLDLRAMGLDLRLDDLQTTFKGAPATASCRVTAVVKVSSEKSALYVAAENLLGKSREEMAHIAELVLEGAIRERFRRESFEDLDKDFDMWAGYFQQTVAGSLLNIGLEPRCVNMHDTNLEGVA